MLGNEADDIVTFGLRGLEAGHTVGTDDKFVSVDAATVAVYTTVAGPSHSVTTVEAITCIFQDFLYADASLVIFKG